MDFNEDTLATLVATRLAEARAFAARRRLVPRRRSGVRARLGAVLIAIGRRLAERDPAPGRVEPSHA